MSSDLDAFMAAMIAAPVSISLPEAQRIAAVHYGLDASAERLTGERDENFKLSCADGSEYVLKIAPAAEEPSVTDLPTAALLHVEKTAPQLPCPRVKRNFAGDTQIRFLDAAGSVRTGRVLTYVAGQPLRVAARSSALRSTCGRLAARLGIALRDFKHPASRRELIWDLRQLPKLRALLDEQPEFPRAAFVRDFIDRFVTHVHPRFDSLRQQVIHNDLNDRNIIISAADPTQVAAVIDYGDLTQTVLIADLAILIAEQIVDVATLHDTVVELTVAYTRRAAAGTRRDRAAADADRWEDDDERGDSVLAPNQESRRHSLRARHSRLRPQAPRHHRGVAIRRPAPALSGVHLQRTNMSTLTSSDTASSDILTRRRRALGPTYGHFYSEPVHIVRARGVWMYDARGRAYLDAYNNVPVVGHSHPYVVEALARQASVLNTHTRYLTDQPVELAERVLATMPQEIGHVLFTCTGSESNDLAVRISKVATGGGGIIITEYAYHGTTETLAGMSPSSGTGKLGPNVYSVPAPIGSEAAALFPTRVGECIERMRAQGVKPAALLVDTIFSSDGVGSHPPGFLAEATEQVRAAGGLLIADEVQPGFARTGEHMWGFQRHGVVPDIVTMGKPMGNGHPIAALAVRPEVMAPFARQTRYFNTFGGTSVSCAVARRLAARHARSIAQRRVAIVRGHLSRCFGRCTHTRIPVVRSAPRQRATQPRWA